MVLKLATLKFIFWCLAGLTWSVDIYANQIILAPDQVEKIVIESVQEYVKLKKVGIDPIVIDQITTSVIYFTGNFCGQYQTIECEKNFDKKEVFYKTIENYLEELIEKLPTSIRSVGDRLADGKFYLAGYPDNVQHLSIGFVRLSKKHFKSKLYIQTATGTKYLGTNINALLLHSGNNTIIVDTGDKKRVIKISVKPGFKQTIQNINNSLNAILDTPLIPRSSAFCYVNYPEKFTGPLAFFNWGRVQFAEPADIRAKNLAPFAQQSALKIQTIQDSKIKCDKACKYGLESLFAEAISVWRSGCSRCNPNALVLFQVDNATWLDWRIERRLNIDDTELDLNVGIREETMAFKPSPSWTYGLIVPYVNITNNHKLIKKICSLPESKAAWVGAAKDNLCKAEISTTLTGLNPIIKLKDDSTACGSLAVACGLPNGNIEINVGKYQFSAETNLGEGFTLGTQNEFNFSLDLWRVIFHEVGHWFGVPHSDIIGKDAVSDIMNKQYNENYSCVSGQSLIMLNNASDLRWVYRITEGGALEPPSPK